MQLIHSQNITAMKQHFFLKLRLALFVLTGLVASHITYAQTADKDKKTTIRVKVTEDENGKDIEKEYQVKSMSDDQKKQFVDKVLDSLGVDSKKGGKVVSVTIDDGGGNKHTMSRKRKLMSTDDRDDHQPLAFNWTEDFPNDVNFNTAKFRAHMRNFERDMKPRARVMLRDMENFGERMGDVWGKELNRAGSVRDLNVYSNNPDNGVLNMRFQAPQKGDLTITVTDVKGKEVGKKDVKDFSGTFVGQIDLKKNTKGTVFVTVVQNEDGAVKRVVIP